VYELTEGGKPFKVGVIAGDPFSSRSYQGAGSQHRSGPEKTGTIVIVIPDTTQQAMRASNRQISVSIWRLLVSDRGSIDLSRLNDLRSKKLLEEVATIAPNSLLDLMK
jgi:hypothetical protein